MFKGKRPKKRPAGSSLQEQEPELAKPIKKKKTEQADSAIIIKEKKKIEEIEVEKAVDEIVEPVITPTVEISVQKNVKKIKKSRKVEIVHERAKDEKVSNFNHFLY
jgi:hypothetical protein